jgi:hypothetical protein
VVAAHDLLQPAKMHTHAGVRTGLASSMKIDTVFSHNSYCVPDLLKVDRPCRRTVWFEVSRSAVRCGASSGERIASVGKVTRDARTALAALEGERHHQGTHGAYAYHVTADRDELLCSGGK